MNIEIDGLTKAQAIALEDMLATWVNLGNMGASRWTAFYADGDGNFRPRVRVDGRTPQFTDLMSSEEKWPGDEYHIDFDVIAWRLRDHEQTQPKRPEEGDRQ